MNPVLLIICASLINWISTTILVESSLFQPYRDWVLRLGTHVVLADGRRLPPSGALPEGVSHHDIESARVDKKPWSIKYAQLVTCIMCTGVWVVLIEALVLGTPWHHVWYAVPAAGLLYKAGGHFIYEARSRVAKP